MMKLTNWQRGFLAYLNHSEFSLSVKSVLSSQYSDGFKCNLLNEQLYDAYADFCRNASYKAHVYASDADLAFVITYVLNKRNELSLVAVSNEPGVSSHVLLHFGKTDLDRTSRACHFDMLPGDTLDWPTDDAECNIYPIRSMFDEN